jgi:hypothetical protein
MKDLLIKTAQRTGIVDSDVLATFLEQNANSDKSGQRLDELLFCGFSQKF